MYLPAVVGCGYYFEKKRAIATGIAVCGTGIGTFAMAPFAKFLLFHLDWKNTHYVFGEFCILLWVRAHLCSFQCDQSHLNSNAFRN